MTEGTRWLPGNAIRAIGNDPYLHEVIGKMLGEITFVDTKEEQIRLSTETVVTSYHIDSQAGLKVFVDAMSSVFDFQGAWLDAARGHSAARGRP